MTPEAYIIMDRLMPRCKATPTAAAPGANLASTMQQWRAGCSTIGSDGSDALAIPVAAMLEILSRAVDRLLTRSHGRFVIRACADQPAAATPPGSG